MTQDDIEQLLWNNKRKLKTRDGQSHYYELVTNNVEEPLAYALNKLFELLQFSAAEMWIGKREFSYGKISLKEIKSISRKLKLKIKMGYYDDDHIKECLRFYDDLKKKDYKERTMLEDHIYVSLSKELFCYKAGHKLVRQHQKKSNKIGENYENP